MKQELARRVAQLLHAEDHPPGTNFTAHDTQHCNLLSRTMLRSRHRGAFDSSVSGHVNTDSMLLAFRKMVSKRHGVS